MLGYRKSKRKKIRRQGFRTRMKTSKGRRMINARRRKGMRVNVKGT